PDHNAVIIRAADLAAVRAALSGVDGVDGIEDHGQARISVRPSSDAPVVDAVEAALREKGVSVDEIRVERGRLDDVFRQITATG
ncbi:MAG: ABC transporter ATP-binding protein, partial [Pseudomonadota bacterium]|nr:ABC transporter ATP-binding protein [Pseudomonadota bacterium]